MRRTPCPPAGWKGARGKADLRVIEDAARDLAVAAAKAEHQVQGGLLLDVVVGEGAAILQLLPGEDEALLIRGDA